jgi:hypothetical protein
MSGEIAAANPIQVTVSAGTIVEAGIELAVVEH